ncbi:unnamed protein product [Timema podura]|uniref:Uncharacterized protein n=1 Tax=Timema podura TaxID=61482 RepID=A0ABN7NZU6_TIMPD|nr:unnamed protein product [Timema podura]
MESSQGQRDTPGVKDVTTTLGNGMQASCAAKNHSRMASQISAVLKSSFCHNSDIPYLLTRNFVALSPIVTSENVE